MISDGHVYLLDTLNVYKAHDKVNALEEGVDYELDVIAITDLSGEITGETNLVIILSETLEDTLVLEYTPVVTKTEGNIGNNISLNGQSLAQESTEAPILWARQFSDAGVEDLEIIVNSSVGAENNPSFAEGIFENTKEKIKVTGTKVWENGPQPEIELQLFRNGVAHRDAVTLATGVAKYEWTELDKTDIDGNEYTYTIDEIAVPVNYVKSISEDKLTIKNRFVTPLIDIPVEKVWQDENNQDGIRPDTITVNHFANDVLINSAIVSAEDSWEYSFTDLAKYEAGEEIAYSITEDEVEGYETVINEFEITNSYTPEVIEISGSKTWVDADNEKATRPDSIKVNLFADGEQVDSIDVSATDDWNYSFVNLPKYQSGQQIDYSITEESVIGYETTIDGLNITNTLKPIEEEPTNELDQSDDPDDSVLSEGTKIPETATSIYNLFMIGAVFLAGGLALLLILRKRSITN